MVDLGLFLGCDFVGEMGLMLAVKRGLQRMAWMLRRRAGDRCGNLESDGDVVFAGYAPSACFKLIDGWILMAGC